MLTGLFLSGLLVTAAAALEPLTEENSWAFEPPEEIPYAESRNDLRGLNEAVAGEAGFVRTSRDGNEFVDGAGRPLRFWCTHTGIKPDWSPEQADRHARWLASLGVNLVITGGGLNPKHEGAALTDVDETALDNTFKAVAAFRKNGIYTMLRMYWAFPGNMRHVPPEWGIEGYGGKNPDMHGVLFVSPTLQKAYKAWVRRLMTTPNPYTGIALKDDPSVALFEIQNEDSLLFFTFNKLHGGPRRRLEAHFADWAAETYGSLGAALEAWDGQAVEGDAPADGRLGLMNVWFLTHEGRGQINEQRVRDQLRFLIEFQQDFYAEMKRFLTEELGCRMLITPSNFRSADLVFLEDALRWTYKPMDAVCNNTYFSMSGKSAVAGWRVDAGDLYVPKSGTTSPLELPTNKKQVVGKPFLITETLWNRPNPYEAEGPLLVAAYQSLNGLDAVSWAGPRAVTWSGSEMYMDWWTVNGSHPIRKFNCAEPATMGQFPAAALLYRKGYVQPGETVVHEVRSLDAIVARKPPMIAESFAFDPTQFTEDYREDTDVPGGVRREAFLVGRVETVYGGDPAESYAADITEYLSDDGSTVRSTTGELTVRQDVGLFTLDAPKAQAAAGFLARAGGRFELTDVVIESADDYASIVVVALDDQPLTESRRVLVQVGTHSTPTGWKAEPATWEQGERTFRGERLVSTGQMPWRVRYTDSAVAIDNPNLSEATLLDEVGRAGREVSVSRDGDTLRVDLPPDTMWLILE